MSVLAHLVTSRGEPGVTQALAYILNQQPGVVQALVNLLDAANIKFDPRHRVESERGDDGERIPGRPDMKICDSGGQLRVLVENKFWAGLTNSQPVDYLKMLPEAKDLSSGLLFIVPKQRVEMIWNELKTRCHKAGLDLGQDSPKGAPVRWVTVGTKTMLVTNWQNVLNTLDGAANGEDIWCDLLQFRQLVKTLENLQAFPALRSDEVTNAEAAQRMINYIELINYICEGLAEADIAYRGNAGSSFNDQAFYCALKWPNPKGRTVGWLALPFSVWRTSGGITPLWLWMAPDYCLPNRFDELENLFEGVHVWDRRGDKFIPIRLKLGVERERVVEDAVEQIQHIFEMLT